MINEISVFIFVVAMSYLMAELYSFTVKKVKEYQFRKNIRDWEKLRKMFKEGIL